MQLKTVLKRAKQMCIKSTIERSSKETSTRLWQRATGYSFTYDIYFRLFLPETCEKFLN